MVVLPVVKLGTLALKTICKPIANRLKKQANNHPKFREFIISIAQANHRFTTRVQRRIYGHATDVAIRPLNQEKAVQAAADLLGELFVFTIGVISATVFDSEHNGGHFMLLGGYKMPLYHNGKVAGAAVIFEVQRTSRAEARKEELRKQEIEAIKSKNEELAGEVQLLKQKLGELEQLARERGLSGILKFRHAPAFEDKKTKA